MIRAISALIFETKCRLQAGSMFVQNQAAAMTPKPVNRRATRTVMNDYSAACRLQSFE